MMEVIHVTEDGLAPESGHGATHAHGAAETPASQPPRARTAAAVKKTAP